jgi:hypothetical protein
MTLMFRYWWRWIVGRSRITPWPTLNDCIAIRVPGLPYGDGGVQCRYFEDTQFESALDNVLQYRKQEALFAS